MEIPLDIDTLRRAAAAGSNLRYRYFWGHKPRPDGHLSDSIFSQWWPCRFTVDGQLYTTAEQFMMAGKARLFRDAEALTKILETNDPAACKALGRKVENFADLAWAGARFDLVTRGNVAKFGQQPAYREYLLGTGDEILVEASPRDQIWGSPRGLVGRLRATHCRLGVVEYGLEVDA